MPDSSFTSQPGALTLKPLFSVENAWEWTAPEATLVLPTPTPTPTHGAGALAVPGVGYVRAVSREFDSCEILQPTPTLKLNVFIPPNQPNPSWLGTVAVEVTCPAVSHYRSWGRESHGQSPEPVPHSVVHVACRHGCPTRQGTRPVPLRHHAEHER